MNIIMYNSIIQFTERWKQSKESSKDGWEYREDDSVSKCLPHKCEDPSSDRQYPCEAEQAWWPHGHPVLGKWRQEVLRHAG